MINPIVVSCLDRTEFCDWIQQFKAADVPVLSPPPPVYDIIYTPTKTEVRPASCFQGTNIIKLTTAAIKRAISCENMGGVN